MFYPYTLYCVVFSSVGKITKNTHIHTHTRRFYDVFTVFAWWRCRLLRDMLRNDPGNRQCCLRTHVWSDRARHVSVVYVDCGSASVRRSADDWFAVTITPITPITINMIRSYHAPDDQHSLVSVYVEGGGGRVKVILPLHRCHAILFRFAFGVHTPVVPVHRAHVKFFHFYYLVQVPIDIGVASEPIFFQSVRVNVMRS